MPPTKPPVLEEALAESLRHVRAALRFVRPGPEPRAPLADRLKGATSELNEAIVDIEALALRGSRPATRAVWAAIACDLAQDEGEVTATLAQTIARMLPALLAHESVREALAASRVVGPWCEDTFASEFQWVRFELTDLAADVEEDGALYVWRSHCPATQQGTAPTLREAMLAADEHLCSGGRILLGGIPDEVLDGATATARVDADGRIEDEPGEEPELQPRPAREEEAQPDASWLRLVSTVYPVLATGHVWTYHGRPPDRDACITGANAAEVLRGWLQTRRLLHSFHEATTGGVYEFVTLAPLDGDWCGACGDNMNGPRFIGSRIRLVGGEEARVCRDCAETLDEQPDGSEGRWP